MSLLAIGDALVAQIPALLLSIAAAAIVTRVTSPLDLAGQIGSQFGSARTWTPVAAILGAARRAARHAAHHHPARRRRSPASSPGSCARPPSARRRVEPVAVEPPSTRRQIGWDEVSERCRAQPRDRLWPGRPGRRAQGRAADGAASPASAASSRKRTRLRRAAGPRARRHHAARPTPIGSSSPASSSARTRSGPTRCSRSTPASWSASSHGERGQGSDLRPRRGLDRARASADAAIVAGYTVVDPGTVVATHLNQVSSASRRRAVRPGRGAEAARRAEGTRAAARRRALAAAAAADHAHRRCCAPARGGCAA